jgi:hypothetical protein
VPEGLAKEPGVTVIQVDATKTPSSFGFRVQEFDRLRAAIIPGSGS